jgi:hypothetical protein
MLRVEKTLLVTKVVPLFLESHPKIIGARLRSSFTHSICVLSAACVAGEISIQEWWSVRRCRDQHVIAVDVDVQRSCPDPVETHRIHSIHLFLLPPELDRSRRRRRGWRCCGCWRSGRGRGWRRCRRGCRARCSGAIATTRSERDRCVSPPDDHFAASPHCRVPESGSGRAGGAGSDPTIRVGIVSPASVNVQAIISAPNNHFNAGPHYRVKLSGSGRAGGAGGGPTICAGIVSATAVQQRANGTTSTPHDHFTIRPDRRVKVPAKRRVGGTGGCPTVGARIIPTASIQEVRGTKVIGTVMEKTAPDDHFTVGPHCRVKFSAFGRVSGAGGGPTIRARIISSTGVQKKKAESTSFVSSAPHNHFTAAPDRCVMLSAIRRVGGAGRCPTVSTGIVSASGVRITGKTAEAAPDNHFSAGPHRCVTPSGRRRVGGAGGCPTIRARIISPTGVQKIAKGTRPAPDDHFSASPYCRVPGSGFGRVGGAG